MTFDEVGVVSKRRLLRGDIVLPDLSYQVVGVLFEVYNALGFGHLERVYQKALESAFEEKGIPCVGQPSIPMKYHGSEVGRYVPDFLVADALVVELKQDVKLTRAVYNQVNAYLKASGYSLAIIACFNKEGLVFRRLVNIY